MTLACRTGTFVFVFVLVLMAACSTDKGATSSGPPPCPTHGDVPPLNDEAHQRCRCERGEAVGCTRAAVLVHEGFGGPRAPDVAAPLYERGCDAGHAAACRHLALLRVIAGGPTPDEASIRRLLGRACDGGDGTGCLLLAERLAALEPKSSPSADAALRRACERGVSGTCDAQLAEERAPLSEGDGAAKLARFVQRHVPELQRCYEVQLQKGHRRPMAVELEFDLEPTRRVGAVQIVSRTAATDGLIACLQERMRTWTTPAVEETTTVSHPLVFSPADPPAASQDGDP